VRWLLAALRTDNAHCDSRRRELRRAEAGGTEAGAGARLGVGPGEREQEEEQVGEGGLGIHITLTCACARRGSRAEGLAERLHRYNEVEGADEGEERELASIAGALSADYDPSVAAPRVRVLEGRALCCQSYWSIHAGVLCLGAVGLVMTFL
jgi:hypothetical protein